MSTSRATGRQGGACDWRRRRSRARRGSPTGRCPPAALPRLPYHPSRRSRRGRGRRRACHWLAVSRVLGRRSPRRRTACFVDRGVAPSAEGRGMLLEGSGFRAIGTTFPRVPAGRALQDERARSKTFGTDCLPQPMTRASSPTAMPSAIPRTRASFAQPLGGSFLSEGAVRSSRLSLDGSQATTPAVPDDPRAGGTKAFLAAEMPALPLTL